MADEVCVIEMKKPASGYDSNVAGSIVTTQVLDIGTQSAAFNEDTDFIIIQSNGTGFWFKQGNSTVSAAATTNGNTYLPADAKSDPYPVDPSNNYVDTAS